MSRLIQFFDRPCCGTSSAQALSDFLSERLADQASVQFHDLNVAGAEPVNVPISLITHLSSRPAGALPVMLVDGHLVAAGTMPNYLDALELARGEIKELARGEGSATERGVLPVATAPGPGGGNCC